MVASFILMHKRIFLGMKDMIIDVQRFLYHVCTTEAAWLQKIAKTPMKAAIAHT
jgi:hypothetical protein